MTDPLIVAGVPTSPMDLECPNGCGVPIVDGPPVQADNEWASALIADHLHMDCPVARTLAAVEATVALAREGS